MNRPATRDEYALLSAPTPLSEVCVAMAAGGHLSHWSSQHDRMQNDAGGQPSPLNIYSSARQLRRSKLFRPLSSSAVKKRATPRRPREPTALRSVPECGQRRRRMHTHVALRSRKTVGWLCRWHHTSHSRYTTISAAHSINISSIMSRQVVSFAINCN